MKKTLLALSLAVLALPLAAHEYKHEKDANALVVEVAP